MQKIYISEKKKNKPSITNSSKNGCRLYTNFVKNRRNENVQRYKNKINFGIKIL